MQIPSFNAPIVGRDRALEQLQHYAAEASAGNGKVVFISGEAGLGKTRLATEFEKGAASTGFQILIGRCVPGASSPYLPFLDAFRHYSRTGTVQLSRIYEAAKAAAPDIAGATPIIGNILRAYASMHRSYSKIPLGAPPLGISNQALTQAKVEKLDGKVRKIVKAATMSAPDIAAATPVIGPYLRVSATLIREYQKAGFDSKSESERALFELLGFLKRTAEKQPLILRLEDLHWADSASIQMIHFFARNAQGLRVLLVGTFRPEEIMGGAQGSPHPLLESLRVMRREGLCAELALERLSGEDMGRAIEGMLGGKVEGKLLNLIEHESGGNPLFATEITQLLYDDGAILLKNGLWQSSKDARMTIPATCKEVVMRRMERLSPEERRTLECATIIGEWFDPCLIEEGLGINRLRLLETLDSIERNYQLISAREDVYRFGHELVRRVAYESISPPRRKELHRIIGTLLEGRIADEEDYAVLAYHFKNAGVPGKTIEYSLMAGEWCMEKYSVPEAVPYFQSVLELSGSNSLQHHQDRLRALEGLGNANTELCNYQQATQQFEEALRSSPPPDEQMRIRILLQMAACWAPYRLGKGDSTKANDYLREVEASSTLGALERGMLLSTRAIYRRYAWQFDDADRDSTEAEKIFGGIGDLRRKGDELINHAMVCLCRNSTAEALEKAEDVIHNYLGLLSPTSQATAYYALGMTYLHMGNAGGAVEQISKYASLSEKIGDSEGPCWGNIIMSLAHEEMGDLETAKSEAEESQKQAIAFENDYMLLGARAMLAIILAHQMEAEEAERVIHETEALGASYSSNTPMFSPIFYRVARAELLALKGEWDHSGEAFRKEMGYFSRMNFGTLLESIVRRWYADSLMRRGKREEADEQYGIAIELSKKMTTPKS